MNKIKINKIKCYLLCSILFINSIACRTYYNFLKDKNVVLNRTAVATSDKFILTVYYNNANVYRNSLERGEIKDGHYERKEEMVFYERSFVYFFSEIFTHSPIIKIDKDKLKNMQLSLSTLCEIRNSNGELIFWYSYDDMNEKEQYMLLNDRLIIKNNKLLNLTEMILNRNLLYDN